MATRGIPRGKKDTQAPKAPPGVERRKGGGDSDKPAVDRRKAPPPDNRRAAAREVAMNASRELTAKLQGAALVKKMGESAKIDITIPELSDLEVTIARPPPVSDEEIDIYIANLKLTAYEPQPKPKGEPLDIGDQILVDSKGYCRGAVFSAQVDSWLLMQENPLVPTLFSSLVGLPVGESTVVTLELPDDYPDPDFAGHTAAFAVLVKEALSPPGRNISDEELLVDLGFGTDLESGRQHVREELEHVLADQMVQATREEVMNMLEAQAQLEITDDIIDIELEKAWRKTEGENLAKSGVSLEEQKWALKEFVEFDERRQQARSLLWRRALVEKLADDFGSEEDELKELMNKAAAAAGIDTDLVRSALNKMTGERKELVEGLKLQRALDRIMEKVTITFVDDEDYEDEDEGDAEG